MQVFAKRTLQYDPIAQPCVTFATEKDRDDLIRVSQPGDLLLFVGSLDDQTPAYDHGRLLGMAEFSHTPIDVTTKAEDAVFTGLELRQDGGPTTPCVLPLTKAWYFQHNLKLIDTLREQLTFDAVTKAILLDEEDTRTVLALPRVEVFVTPPFAIGAISTSLPSNDPTTGPVPTNWSGAVTRIGCGEAYTYALRFGERDVWKIGHTQSLVNRLAEINQHVPHEELGERWCIVLQHYWTCSLNAYEMEQRVLYLLTSFRTEGERVRCSEATLKKAWNEVLQGRAQMRD